MVENEAKQKWCPFSRCHGMNKYNRTASVNRGDNDVLSKTKCLGKDCACWMKSKTEPKYAGHCGLINGEN